jgi:predicted N-acetyltransferase YhbS
MIHIRTMTASDVPLGMRLKDQAGWNQVEADWQRVLTLQPEGCFVAELNGQSVGTTATSVFGSVGWILAVLVDDSVRGQGVGTQLMRRALAYLDGCGVPTARLDATPLGRPIYERLGFVAEYELGRWTGIAAEGKAATEVRPAAWEDMDAILELDFRATGTDRSRLLERLYQERPQAMHVATGGAPVTGYAWLRPGSRFAHAGPTIAQDENAGRALFDVLSRHSAGQPILLDIPVDNRPATLWAESRGLRVQRQVTRMVRGKPVHDQPGQLWSSFGPEKG